jgi:hypothetical protein
MYECVIWKLVRMEYAPQIAFLMMILLLTVMNVHHSMFTFGISIIYIPVRHAQVGSAFIFGLRYFMQ